MQPIVIAHRTCPRDGAENSLGGVATAAQAGADAVEVDVRRTADGTPVLLHDRWMLRTTGWPIRLEWTSTEWATKRRLLGGRGDRLPTFAAALDALGPTLRMAIDVKDPGAGASVIAEVRNQHRESQVLFWSKFETNVRVAVETAPDLEIALLRDTSNESELAALLDDTVSFGANAISAHWSQVDERLQERCRDRDIKLYAWCKTPEIDMAKLAVLDGLVTDWPAAGRSAVEALPG